MGVSSPQNPDLKSNNDDVGNTSAGIREVCIRSVLSEVRAVNKRQLNIDNLTKNVDQK